MRFASGLPACLVSLAVLSACATPPGLAPRTLTKGAQVSLPTVLAAHQGQKICIDYEASSNSCTSIVDVTVNGSRVNSRETGALRDSVTGQVHTLTLTSTATLEGDKACVEARNIQLISPTMPQDMKDIVLGSTRSVMQSSGGVCASYFKAGDGYVVSTRGRDGSIFPPGDSRAEFFSGQRVLRAQ